ncbi:MAG TPA: hypothetical protein DCS09_08520 [Porphyromonadaceae bacterium]|nr:hypothetical protein [Porphyromonadaceae bacterium]
MRALLIILIMAILAMLFTTSYAEEIYTPSGVWSVSTVDGSKLRVTIEDINGSTIKEILENDFDWMPVEEEPLLTSTDFLYGDGVLTGVSSAITTIPEEEEYIRQLKAIWSRKVYYQETELPFKEWVVSQIED